MTTNSQFWLGVTIDVLIATGTLGAVVVALFGERIRSRLFRPTLTLRLHDERGELSWVQLDSPDGSSRDEDARYYHLVLTNESRWPIATRTQVHLTRIDAYDASGNPFTGWNGDVPLNWQFPHLHPLQRNVAHSALCDFCSVVRDKWVQLEVAVVPKALAKYARQRDPFRMIVTVVAQCAETSSEEYRFRVSWNGQWDDDGEKMSKNLVIEHIQDGA